MGGKNKLNSKKSARTLESESKVEQVQQEPEAVEEHTDAQLQSLFERDSSLPAYMWLLVFSVMMFTFPFATFYGVRSWLQESFDLTAFQTNCFSVLSAVLVVNLIICIYVYKAFTEVDGRDEAPAAEREEANKAQKKEK